MKVAGNEYVMKGTRSNVRSIVQVVVWTRKAELERMNLNSLKFLKIILKVLLWYKTHKLFIILTICKCTTQWH